MEAEPDPRFDRDPERRDQLHRHERLTAERAGANARLADRQAELARILEDTADVGADDEHDIEGASMPFEREQLRATLRQAAAQVEEIDAALARLAAGTYGRCEVCGDPIGAGRLEIQPWARTCVTCAARPDRRGPAGTPSRR